MNNQEKYKEDLLRQYINPERIEKAPEGFTSKVMTRILIEAAPLKVSGRLRNKNLVPVISAAITILLIVAAFLIPGSETDLSALPVVELIKNINVSLPEINLTSIFSFNLSALMIYVFIGILILTLFDRALNMLFHREK
ncbi:MAG: hypothetical protein IMZ64_08015 [Bacteroidetes bacterium]|nr:hypothetical protein [Bacteroidota bacterium]